MILKQKTQMKIFTVNQTTIEQLDNFNYQLLPVYREGIEVGVCHRDRANCGANPDQMAWTAAIGFDISPSFTSIVAMLKWCDDLLGYETIGVF
jgi:hypothetical protein